MNRFDPNLAKFPVTANFPSERPIEPAEANACWEWLETMAKVHLTAVRVEVEFAAAREALEKAGPGFEERLGEELAELRLGMFDSLKPGEHFTAFFYLSSTVIIDAIQFLKFRLKELALLPASKIAVADCDSRTWRVWWPKVALIKS